MLKNFWYGLAFSTEVGTEEPYPMMALGQRLVIFRRGDGTPAILSDLCVHRGGAISGGWLSEDKSCVVCPYHGWEYEQSGQCTNIPANVSEIPIPKTARVDSYPTVERYGIIWGYLGDLPEGERVPIPELPYLEDPKYARVEGQFEWNAHVDRVLENGMDLSHTPFVHSGSFGNKDNPEVTSYDVFDVGDWHARFRSELDPPQPSGMWKRLYPADRPKTTVEAGFWFPNISILDVSLPMGHMVIYNLHVPIDDERTVSKFINLRTFFTNDKPGIRQFTDADAKRRTLKIFKEDQKVVEEQRPELLPLDLADELHTKSDRIAVEYRKRKQKAYDLGWGIDTHKVSSGYSKHTATVIPSPARREVAELANAWVMKEVPVLGAEPSAGRPNYDTPEKALARRAASEVKAERAKKAAAKRRAEKKKDAEKNS
ncbi:MAG: phenylpropionate dioxygenase-like ring-hydroxylating dioxygenase large terminal subunit [Glaciecola sp.]|jgi:phenylpropionate dioxygenase-like ring-hydroxylating dioxygenase large terminal subunit